MMLSRNSPRSGTTYIEVCVATVVLAILIVPATKQLPQLLANQRNIETSYGLSLAAREKIDTAVMNLAGDFAELDVSGDLAADGHDDWRYHLVVTIPAESNDAYAVVRCDAWLDADGDSIMDGDEIQARFDTVAADVNWTP